MSSRHLPPEVRSAGILVGMSTDSGWQPSPYADLAAAPPPPPVDYARTNPGRTRWCEVPASVTQWLGHALGASVVEAGEPSGMGFTSSYAGTLTLADGRRVFAKVALPGQDVAWKMLRREAEVLKILPDGVPHARLLAQSITDEAAALVLEQMEGRVPGSPWAVTDAQVVLHGLGRMQQSAPQVCPDAVSGTLGVDVQEDEWIQGVVAGLRDGSQPWPSWVLGDGRGSEVAELAAWGPTVWANDGVVHNDLRPDNCWVTESGDVVFLDWNWLLRGPRWADAVGLLPQMHAEGVGTAALMAGSPLFDGVSADEVDSLVAVLLAYFVGSMAAPIWPGGTAVIAHHRARYATLFGAYLAHRRAWT